MRRLILTMQVSLDGFIEGPEGAMDWFAADDAAQWRDMFERLDAADALLLGRGMYPGYAAYWHSALSSPEASKNERRYARLAQKIPHFVFSETLERADWGDTKIVRGDLLDTIRTMKRRRGKDIVAWGGAKLAASLIESGLVDEYQLIVNPVVLGGGKPLFKGLSRRSLEHVGTKTYPSGAVLLRFKNAAGRRTARR
jgi:dihydrofolate reductase